jgi:hypothetical protein
MSTKYYPLDKEVFKLLFVDAEVLFSLPNVVIVHLNNICGNKAHLNESLNASLEEILIDLLAISILGDLI